MVAGHLCEKNGYFYIALNYYDETGKRHQLKDIQAWLSHSAISTAANIYAHQEFNSKIAFANAMIQILPQSKKQIGASPNELAPMGIMFKFDRIIGMHPGVQV